MSRSFVDLKPCQSFCDASYYSLDIPSAFAFGSNLEMPPKTNPNGCYKNSTIIKISYKISSSWDRHRAFNRALGTPEPSWGFTGFTGPLSPGVRLPSGLVKLVFGDNFDQNLEGVIFPVSLQELTFGAFFAMRKGCGRLKFDVALHSCIYIYIYLCVYIYVCMYVCNVM